MALSNRTEVIFRAQQKALLPLREAYIDLHGMPVEWLRQKDAAPRRDFYNDVVQGEWETEPIDMKIVAVDVSVQQLIDIHLINAADAALSINTMQANMNVGPYKFYASLKHEVMKGDLIRVPHESVEPNRSATGAINYHFIVVDVVKAYHRIAPSKHLMLAPYY